MKKIEQKRKEDNVWMTISIEVPGMRNFSDMDEIKGKIKDHVNSILPRINIEDIAEWGLKFYVSFMCTDFICVGKKFIRYPAEKEYEVLIGIAIPDSAQVIYGMPPAEDGKIGYFHPGSEKCAHLIKPEYEKYKSLDQYILNSTIKAINYGFTIGFTCKGKKIKFQDI